jgi:hypothetical protein
MFYFYKGWAGQSHLLLLALITELKRPKSRGKMTIWVQIFMQYPVNPDFDDFVR